MFLRMVEYDGQHKGTRVLFERHPLISEHHAVATVHTDNVMVIVHQLLCLFARTNSNGLIGMDLIERFGHAVRNVTMRLDLLFFFCT